MFWLNAVTHLNLVHLLYLGGKEPKNGWVITVFEFPARKKGDYNTGLFSTWFLASVSLIEEQIYNFVERQTTA